MVDDSTLAVSLLNPCNQENCDEVSLSATQSTANFERPPTDLVYFGLGLCDAELQGAPFQALEASLRGFKRLSQDRKGGFTQRTLVERQQI